MIPMFEAEVLEFPAFSDLPKREKSKIQRVWDTFRELSKITDEKGMLIPQSFAAKVLDVSRQRVNAMIEEGRLEAVEVNGVPFVTENSVVAYAKGERKAGRPHGLPTTLKESFKRACKK
jgi:hypothetical protein